MFRNISIALVLLSIGIVLAVVMSSPGIAAPVAQQENPPERLRPDQYSYHGREDIPIISASPVPAVESTSPSGPVEHWSKMTFESYTNNNWEIYFATGDFTNLVRLTNNSVSDIHPRLNRGCTRIVFASYLDGHDYEIYSMNPDGSGLSRLTNNNNDDVKPAWSPDGTKIAFQSYRDGNAEVYVMNADGSNQTRLTYTGTYAGEPSWSPDGSRIAFTAYITYTWRIWVMNADGSNLVQLSQQPYSENPVWSPDGTQIGFDADNTNNGMQELWSMDSNGLNQHVRVYPAYDSTILANGWSPDSMYLVFTEIHLIYYEGEWYWEYANLKKALQSGQVYIINSNRYYDWNIDWITVDNQPPVTGMNVPTSPVPYQFNVSWWGQDDLSGVLNYDVQYRDGSLGAWTDWKVGTTDITAVFSGLGGHNYYFRARARDQAFNIQAWPTIYPVSAFVENFSPDTHINPIDLMTRGNQISLSWQGFDPGNSGISGYDIQFMDTQSGGWENLLTDTTITNTVFTGVLGHTYNFRSRATDLAMNIEPWPYGAGDTSTTFFAWEASGTARDNTGVPVTGMDISVVPPTFLTQPSDREGKYRAYLASDPPVKTVTWSKAEYGPLPSTDFGAPDALVDIYLPPADNVVQDPGFESDQLPGAWRAAGEYPTTLITTTYHTGGFSALLGPYATFGSPHEFGEVGSYINSSAMVADTQGTIHITWVDPALFKIYYAEKPINGAWSTTEVANTSPVTIENIFMTANNYGAVYIIWSSYTAMYYSVRDLSGSWSAPNYITNCYVDNVIMDDDGNIHVLAHPGSGLLYVKYTIAAGWAAEAIPGAGTDIFSSALAVGTDGSVHFVWTENTYNDGVLTYIKRNVDGSWTIPFVISHGEWSEVANIVLDSSNLPHVVWVQNDQQFALHYSREDNKGNWTAPYDFSDGIDTNSVRLFINDQDTLFVIWSSVGAYSPSQVFFVEKEPDTQWTLPLNITNNPDYGLNLQAKMNDRGEIYAVWEQSIGEFREVAFAKMHGNIWEPTIFIPATGPWVRSPDIIFDTFGFAHIIYTSDDGNDSYLRYVGSLPITNSGCASLSQSFNIPITMTNPTLSFMASFSGVSDLSADEFQVQVSNSITTTTIFTSTAPSGWEHHWIDMSPWSGQQITLTFQLSENASFPPASALLDEVTLGAAHTDVWVDLDASTYYVQPGDTLDFQLNFGNRSSLTAVTDSITMTLPTGLTYLTASLEPEIIGNILKWHFDEFPPGGAFDPITITVAVEPSAPMLQQLVTSVEVTTATPEIELLNNTSQVDALVAYTTHLPLIAR